jgi:gamma-glutamylcyclotransferase (GGCT)/AIG2-like uncharacterized protein YtfP
MKTPYLFVYGSLLSGFRSPAYEYISRYFLLVGPTTVQGTLVDMGQYPAAVPSTDTSSTIKGELYVVKNPAELSWAIGQLDDYEGAVPEAGEKPLYRRDIIPVTVNNETVSATIYWFNGDVSNKPVIYSGDVLAYMREKNN